MLDTVSLWFDYITLPKPDPSKAYVSGAGVFVDDYTSVDQFKLIKTIFCKHRVFPLVRIPFPPDTGLTTRFFNCVTNIYKAECQPVILLDCFHSEASFTSRLDVLARTFPHVAYIELFNELPWMAYPGYQIKDLNELLSLTEKYTKFIHHRFNSAKVISMAPANALAVMDYKPEWGGNNTEQLFRLANETSADIVGLHVYVSNWKQKARFKQLSKTLSDIKALTGKKCWITEIGAQSWEDHVMVYDEWTSRFHAHPAVEEIIWYRQSIYNLSLPDGGFAIHERMSDRRSPLYTKLMTVKVEDA